MKFSILILLLCSLTSSLANTAKVVRIIDGDTFEIEGGEKVRLIGINAPELKDIFGNESKIYLANLLQGKYVELSRDLYSSDRDRYNRLLRYTFIDGIDINQQMILKGFAFAYLKYRFSKSADYEKAQLLATAHKSGIWAGQSTFNLGDSENKTSEGRSNFHLYFLIAIFGSLLLIGTWGYFKK